MICGRCDQPIKPGQKYTKHDVHASSGGGSVVYRHTYLCRRPPTQTAPVSRDRRR